MARRRRKSIASTSEETPKNDTATETAVEGVTDAQEDNVASRSVLDNDTVVDTAVEGITDMQDLEHSAVIATNSVNGSIEYDNDTTVDKTDLKDDIIVAIDEKNGIELNAAEANEEIVAEEEDEDEEDEEEDEGEEEEEEDDLYLESNVDSDLAVNNDDGDEDIDDDIDDDDEEGDEEEDEDDEEENDDNYEVGDDNKLETENEEKHNEEDVKVVNDAGSQENTPAEEVMKSNTQKVVNIKGEGLKKKVRPVGNMNDKNRGVSGQENLKAEHDGRQGDSGVVIEEPDGGKSKEKIEGRGRGNSKQKGKNLRKESRMTTVNGGGSKIVSSEREDKPKQLPKKKSSKKVKSMGMIFICSTKTRNDCFQYKVLGQPASKRETVEKIYKGMRLFLYDIDRKLLYGIYKAAGPGGYNIQPKAFNSQFPAQVRFTVMEDCLPIAEEKFKRVIKDNYYTKKKFDTLLTSQQVKDLCKLFAATKHSKHGASEMPGRGLRRKAPVSKRRDRSRDQDEGLRSDKHRYREYSPYRERVVPPLHQSSRLPLPRTAALPYAYDRALDVDGYRRDPLVEHRDRRDGLIERRDPYIQDAVVERHDPYRQNALVDRRDPYRQDALVERRDLYRQDALVEHLGSYRRPVLDRDAYRPVSLLDHHDVYRPHALLDHDSSYRRRDEVVQRRDLSSLDDEYRRVDPLISYRRAGSSGDDVTMLDRYRSYRDRADYRDPVSTSRLVPEEAGYTIVGRSTAALLPEYRSVRTRYRY